MGGMSADAPYEAAVSDVKSKLSEAQRVIALLGELPEETRIDFDVEEWTERLTVKSAQPKAVLPAGGWFLRG